MENGQARQAKPIEKLEQSLEATIGSLWQCMEQAHDLGSDPETVDRSKEGLYKTLLEDVMQNLERVNQDSMKVNDTVPLEVIQRVDRGQNPEIVAKKQLEDAQVKNFEARTRIFGAHALEQTLTHYLNMWEAEEKGEKVSNNSNEESSRQQGEEKSGKLQEKDDKLEKSSHQPGSGNQKDT
mmetsp:Transcript_20821/g.51062  ORF Transcript_20821/g.51062 Transcript_20821/m.51062 type:complete len:181 (-) Transcript_20821:141-683(-)|eukprot:CAMPEP_0114512874 /NCGR_PEP_ID=MMETSP0109-20121206/15235_1 /TAXON_ID=29199 /ORGANISM="Chlorarachnion reptans, Strain CCCM449" /LENGTH=180 /DNA_ID=CAMNT_0001692641 /DNA_START=39 /DNA_END=581 /DNA_ORIENTATION=-